MYENDLFKRDILREQGNIEFSQGVKTNEQDNE